MKTTQLKLLTLANAAYQNGEYDLDQEDQNRGDTLAEFIRNEIIQSCDSQGSTESFRNEAINKLVLAIEQIQSVIDVLDICPDEIAATETASPLFVVTVERKVTCSAIESKRYSMSHESYTHLSDNQLDPTVLEKLIETGSATRIGLKQSFSDILEEHGTTISVEA